MKVLLKDLLAVVATIALIYLRLRRDYRWNLLNPSPKVKVQTLFGDYEEDDNYRRD